MLQDSVYSESYKIGMVWYMPQARAGFYMENIIAATAAVTNATNLALEGAGAASEVEVLPTPLTLPPTLLAAAKPILFSPISKTR